MKNKITIIAVCVIMLLALSGCGWNESGNESSINNGRMTLIYNDGFAVIYRDDETGVQYFSRSSCGTCVMVNADGTPYIEEYNQEEN